MFHDWPYSRERLPEWFMRPVSAGAHQVTLFPDQLDEVLADLRISTDDLCRWHARGWVSFGPDFNEAVQPWDLNELRFVRDVVRSGLTDAQVAARLDELPRPMDFDPATVAYSFSLGWVQAIPPYEPDVSEFMDEHLDEWLQELSENDRDRLIELRERVNDIIATSEEADAQDASDGPVEEAKE
jgi:hypothetical protein